MVKVNQTDAMQQQPQQQQPNRMPHSARVIKLKGSVLFVSSIFLFFHRTVCVCTGFLCVLKHFFLFIKN